MSGNDFKFGIEKKEKKLSWSIVFAWLYLHTFGKILPKKWNKWAENIVEPYEVTNSDDITKSVGDKDVTLGSELQTEIKVEGINSDEVRQPGDGQSFSLDSELQTESKAEGINSDNINPEGGEVKRGDSCDSGINVCEDDDNRDEFWYDGDYRDVEDCNVEDCLDVVQFLPKTESDQDADIELSAMESDQNAKLFAQIDASQAPFDNQYLQIIKNQAKDTEQKDTEQLELKAEKYFQIIQKQGEEIAQLNMECEIFKEALSAAAQEVVALREETEQLKHNSAEINELDTQNTTEVTHQITSMADIEQIGNSLER